MCDQNNFSPQRNKKPKTQYTRGTHAHPLPEELSLKHCMHSPFYFYICFIFVIVPFYTLENDFLTTFYRLFHFFLFLDASSHIYKMPCPSVGRSVGWLFGPSVGPSVRQSVTLSSNLMKNGATRRKEQRGEWKNEHVVKENEKRKSDLRMHR